MDQQSLLRGLQLLVQSFPALPHTQDASKLKTGASSSISSSPSFSHIRRLLIAPSLSDEECQQLRRYLGHLLVWPHQTALGETGGVALSAPPLPAFPLTVHVIRLFRPLLASLVSDLSATAPASLSTFQHSAVALSQVAALCPHTTHAVAAYLRSSPFSLFDSLLTRRRTSSHSTSSPSDRVPPLHLVYAAYRYLAVDSALFHGLFHGCVEDGALQSLLTYNDSLTRFYAVHCVSALLRLSDAQRSRFHRLHLPPPSPTAPLDPAALEQAHAEALQAELGAVWVASIDPSPITSLPPPHPPSPSPSSPPTHTGGYVALASTAALLESLELYLTQTGPILFNGPAGCGKTSLLHHLHTLHHPPTPSHPTPLPLLTLHVSDSLDSKSLLGSYTCTDTPGEFRWAPGALTRALQSGRWVAVEDVDRAPWELLSGLRALCERGELEVRGEVVRAQPGFRLFATRAADGRASRGWALLAPHFSPVALPALSDGDLEAIIEAGYGAIPRHLRAAVLQTWAVVSGGGGEALGGGRRAGTRDLFRWCRRLAWVFARGEGWNAAGLDEATMDGVVRSLLDCFLAPSATPLTSPPARALLTHLCALWSIPPERVDYHLRLYRPRFEVTGAAVSIGPYDLPVVRRGGMGSGALFTPTRHALRVLESVAAAVELNEPLVLVGEAGVGKTSVLQYLAHALGQRLTVLNLNNQSDASDVVGGYRPYEVRAAVTGLVTELVGGDDLFGKVVSRKANAGWLAALERAVQRREWRKAVRMMAQMADKAAAKLQLQRQGRTEGTGGEVEERKVEEAVRVRWQRFHRTVTRLARQVSAMSGQSSLPLFHFQRGCAHLRPARRRVAPPRRGQPRLR